MARYTAGGLQSFADRDTEHVWQRKKARRFDLAIQRLARYFTTSERFWLNLQDRYDLEIERERLAPVLEEIRPLVRA